MSPNCHSALARVREAPRASPEVEVLECEVGFYDASGFDPGSEDILLGGLVVGGPDPIQAVQVAGRATHRGPEQASPAPGSASWGPAVEVTAPPPPPPPHPWCWGQRVGGATEKQLLSCPHILKEPPAQTKGCVHSSRGGALREEQETNTFVMLLCQ